MKHNYSYRERLRRQSYSQSSRIDVGIIVHIALEWALKAYHTMNYELTLEAVFKVVDGIIDSYAEENKPQPSSFQFEEFQYDNSADLEGWTTTVELARAIAKRTLEHLDVPNNWRTETLFYNGEEVPLIEFRFEYPLVEDKNIAGKVDWVAKNLEDGLVYLIDWKTRKAFTGDFEVAGEDMNLQLSIYQYVLNSMGLDIFGTITYQIRSALPSIPEVTSKGLISKAKIATDRATYEKALTDNGQTIEGYEDFLNGLQDDEYWWLPITIIRGKIELYNRWETVQKITRLMLETTDPIKFESPRCMYCPFFRLCLGEDRGLDVDHLKDMQFTKSER